MAIDFGSLLSQVSNLFTNMKSEAGTACVLPDCGKITVGVRCEGCARRICVKHTYWRLSLRNLKAYCPYCVLLQNPELFRDPDTGGAWVDDTAPKTTKNEGDVIDADYVER